MLDLVRKLLLAGLGTIDLTEEKARALFDELVRRGEMTEKEARDLASGWAQDAKARQARLRLQIDEAIQEAIDRIIFSNGSELLVLAARVAELERKVEQLQAAAAR